MKIEYVIILNKPSSNPNMKTIFLHEENNIINSLYDFKSVELGCITFNTLEEANTFCDIVFEHGVYSYKIEKSPFKSILDRLQQIKRLPLFGMDDLD